MVDHMGILRNLKERFARSHDICMSLDEAISLFKVEPIAWFSHRQESFRWPEVSLTTGVIKDWMKDISVTAHGHHLADIEGISIDGNNALILHVGVAQELTRRGIGQVLLKALAKELASRYGVTSIRFSESSTKYHESGYEKFYAKIGARRLAAKRNQKLDRPDYEWLHNDW